MAQNISILIADDHPIFRTGLVATIETNPRMRVVGVASNGREALDQLDLKAPDIVILDIDMPVMDGIETAKALRDRSCTTKTIFLTMHKDNTIVRSLRSLGVSGYVLKDSADDEIGSHTRRMGHVACYIFFYLPKAGSWQNRVIGPGRNRYSTNSSRKISLPSSGTPRPLTIWPSVTGKAPLNGWPSPPVTNTKRASTLTI